MWFYEFASSLRSEHFPVFLDIYNLCGDPLSKLSSRNLLSWLMANTFIVA